MGGCRMDGPSSPPIQSPEEMVGRFHGELMTALPGWKDQLRNGPEQLGKTRTGSTRSFFTWGRFGRRRLNLGRDEAGSVRPGL